MKLSTTTLKRITKEDFIAVRGFVSDYFSKGIFPFDVEHGNISKTSFGNSYYTTVDAMENFFMESITIRISDHSVGQRRAASEICFSFDTNQDRVNKILDLTFAKYKK
jgi:hypothetical protein|tara:strand:+ start:5988 stop:6311 length:324 start_codon:yes stop_codon:yes gene_type:complete